MNGTPCRVAVDESCVFARAISERSQVTACRQRAEQVAYLWASGDRIIQAGCLSYGRSTYHRRDQNYYAWDEEIVKASIVPLDVPEKLIAPNYARVKRRPTHRMKRTDLVDWAFKIGQGHCKVLAQYGCSQFACSVSTTPLLRAFATPLQDICGN